MIRRVPVAPKNDHHEGRSVDTAAVVMARSIGERGHSCICSTLVKAKADR
jgi:hypothetical protein